MRHVVFVHGFMGGSRQWAGQIAALENEFRVTAVDLPGFGDNAHMAAPDSIVDFGAWVLDELSGREIERFHLVGHSMGGMVAQEMVHQAPGRIDKLVLYGTGATGVLPGRFETLSASRRRAEADGATATAHRIAATWFLTGRDAIAYPDCAAIAERSSLQAILAGLDAMQGWSGAARLADIPASTLIIWGDQDRTYSWGQIEELWHSIVDTSLAVIPNCAHAAHLEKPWLFNGLLADFFGTSP